MANIQYREVIESDIPKMAAIRSKNWGTKEYWQNRIEDYLRSELHPQLALMPRIIYVAAESERIVGFIAGHLTRRFDCDGELQWIDTDSEYRRVGIAKDLFKLLASWFVERNALYICVDSDPDNLIARQFYRKYGATDLNTHWMVWRNIKEILW
jgi:ribosomal protein S18 acetylase RimI-like enzyme